MTGADVSTASARTRLVSWRVIVLVYAALTAAYFWSWWGSLGTTVPHDLGDPSLTTWMVWWNAHAVPFTSRWWNAPIFVPMAGSFALSETLLSLAPLTSPLQWMGASALLAHNIAYALSFPAAALAAHALARHLTKHDRAAWVAGLAFGFGTYRAAQLPHVQMLWTCFVPLGLLALHRYVERRRARDLVLFAVCWLLNGLTSGYLMVFFAVLIALWVVWFVRTWRDLAAIALAGAIGSLPLLPVLWGYHHFQTALGLSRSVQETMTFSADLRAIWATTSEPWLPFHFTYEPSPEGALYPGIVIMAITAIGAVVAWREARQRPWHLLQRVVLIVGLVLLVSAIWAQWHGAFSHSFFGIRLSVSRPARAIFNALRILVAALLLDPRAWAAWRRRSALLFYVAASIVMFAFALGPVAHAWGQQFLDTSPYEWMMKLPGGNTLRVPARFGVLFDACLTIAAALAFDRVLRRRASTVLVACTLLAVGADGWVPKFPLEPAPPRLELLERDAGMPLLSLPLGHGFLDAIAMLHQTQHAHPLINGFSGYQPPHYDPLTAGIIDGDRTVLAALQQYGPYLVRVDRADDVTGSARAYVDGFAPATFLGDTTHGALFKIPGAPAPQIDPADRPIAIAAVHPSEMWKDTSLMLDGDISTYWSTGREQQEGDAVAIDLAQPSTVGRIEMDLGQFALNYPRHLQVAVQDDPAAPPRLVFDGTTAGAAMTAALADPKRVPLTILLPAGTRATRLILTDTGRDMVFFWSISELKVYGR